jgi:hypothetical protein
MAAIMSGVLISTMIRRPSIALTVALMGWIGLMILDSFYTASLTRIPHCFLVSLNPYTAFKLGIKSAMVAETTGK